MARGKTRQQARGHKVREHIIRREREIEEMGISSSQVKSIRDWARRHKNEDRDVEEVIDHTRAEGWDWFVNYRSTWNAARSQYLKELRNGTYASRGMGYLHMLTELAKAPEVSWLYYH